MRFIFFLMSVYIVWPFSVVHARLAPISWTDFDRSAELILHGTPLKMEWGANGAGMATFQVIKILRGDFNNETISIQWSSEVHDQSISDLSIDRLLFLKKDGEANWIGATYGRSYWPLGGRTTDVSKAKNYNPKIWSACLVYPVTLIRFSTKDKENLFGADSSLCPTSANLISVERLINSLNRTKK